MCKGRGVAGLHGLCRGAGDDPNTSSHSTGSSSTGSYWGLHVPGGVLVAVAEVPSQWDKGNWPYSHICLLGTRLTDTF